MDTLDPISRKFRQSKIDSFRDLFSSELDDHTCRFVAEMIWGIIFAGSIRLSKIARALEEPIPERATIKRLSRNLSQEGLEPAVSRKVLELASERIREDSFLVLHRHHLLKKHAKDMDFLDEVSDATGRSIGRGYQLCDIIGWNPPSGEVTALAQMLWSKNEPGYTGEPQPDLINRIRSAMGKRGIIALTLPFTDPELLVQLTRDGSSRYLSQVSPQSDLIYNRKPAKVHDLVRLCRTPYGDTVFFDNESKEQGLFIHYGFLPVRLPQCPDRPLWLVVIRGFDERYPDKEPNVILTTEPMRQNRKVLWRIVEAYYTSLWVQTTNSLIKQRYDFEDVRVRGYTSLKNIASLVLAASYFSTLVRDFPSVDFLVRLHRRSSELVGEGAGKDYRANANDKGG